MKGSRENPSRGTLRPEGKPRLPPGYYLDRSDPDVLVLRSEEGGLVARFSAMGYVAESVERVAWEDHHGQRHTSPSPEQLSE
jgi:hypothetical protein